MIWQYRDNQRQDGTEKHTVKEDLARSFMSTIPLFDNQGYSTAEERKPPQSRMTIYQYLDLFFSQNG